ncbi:MAG: hypothetical protein OIF50_06245 [Flavobacteriaceae bacterium]|nr:hypothetical protein [Flavobacteriaceae bacterium]
MDIEGDNIVWKKSKEWGASWVVVYYYDPIYAHQIQLFVPKDRIEIVLQTEDNKERRFFAYDMPKQLVEGNALNVLAAVAKNQYFLEQIEERPNYEIVKDHRTKRYGVKLNKEKFVFDFIRPESDSFMKRFLKYADSDCEEHAYIASQDYTTLDGVQKLMGYLEDCK